MPALDVGAVEDLGGPDDECNWLVPGRVLMGAVPGDVHADGYSNNGVYVALLHQAGVTDWVNVAGPEMGNYTRDAARLAELDQVHNRPEPRFLTHTITEFSTATDEVIVAAVRSVVTAMRSPRRKAYIHCRAGHGRTGMVAAVTLGTLYPTMPIDTVMNTVQAFHDTRVDSWGHWDCPETREQSQCARSLLAKIRAGTIDAADLGLV